MAKLKDALFSALTFNVLVRLPLLRVRRTVFNVSTRRSERTRFALYFRIKAQWVGA